MPTTFTNGWWIGTHSVGIFVPGFQVQIHYINANELGSPAGGQGWNGVLRMRKVHLQTVLSPAAGSICFIICWRGKRKPSCFVTLFNSFKFFLRLLRSYISILRLGWRIFHVARPGICSSNTEFPKRWNLFSQKGEHGVRYNKYNIAWDKLSISKHKIILNMLSERENNRSNAYNLRAPTVCWKLCRLLVYVIICQVRWVLFSSPFNRWGIWGSERLLLALGYTLVRHN